MRKIQVIKGGPGSGNHGHRGRPGHRGGSLPRGSQGDTSEPKPKGGGFIPSEFKSWAKTLPMKMLKKASKYLDQGLQNVEDVPWWIKPYLRLSPAHRIAFSTLRKAKKIVDKLITVGEIASAYQAADAAKLGASLEKIDASDILDVCDRLGVEFKGTKKATIEFLLNQAIQRAAAKKKKKKEMILII